MTVVVESAEQGRVYSLRLGSDAVGVLRFSLPMEPDPGFSSDEEFSFLGRRGSLGASIRLFEDIDVVSLILTVEADSGSRVEVPQIECELDLAGRQTGWGSASGADGFIVISPPVGEGPVVAVSLRRGQLLDLGGDQVFLPDPQPQSLFDPEPAEGPGRARFAVEPVPVLDGGRRAQSVLRIASYPTFVDAVASLTRGPVAEANWGYGGPVAIDAPDQALVVPAGVMIEPETEPDGPTQASIVNGPPGHHFAQLRGARGSHLVRLSFAPRANDLLADLCQQVVSSEPRQVDTTRAYLVSRALVLGVASDPVVATDWCEREDWLAREDLLGIATAANLAALGNDRALFRDAWGALAGQPVQLGFGLVAMRMFMTGLGVLGAEPLGVKQLLAARAPDDLTCLELGMIGSRSEEVMGPVLSGAINQLGGGQTHGRPLGVTASVAGRLVGVLKMTPESWTLRSDAVDAAAQAETLLLCDVAEDSSNVAGLAWLLLGDLAY